MLPKKPADLIYHYPLSRDNHYILQKLIFKSLMYQTTLTTYKQTTGSLTQILN
jgi:hypothetical protein